MSRLSVLASRTGLVLATAAAAAVALPAPAHAAGSVTNAGGVLTIHLGAPGEYNVQTAWEGPGLELISWESWGSVSGCTEDDPGSGIWRCQGVTRVVVHGTAGDDQLWVDAPVPVEARMGAGADQAGTAAGADRLYGEGGVDELYGGEGNDVLDGGEGDESWIFGDEGNDTINGGLGSDTMWGEEGSDTLSGGAGNDTVYGDNGDWASTDGNDVLNGNEGDDVLNPGGGRDVVHGGSHALLGDTATYDGLRSTGAVSLTLDRLANDGATGEGDNIGPNGDVENLTSAFSAATSTLIGNDGPNVLADDSFASTVVVDGRGGDDGIEVVGASDGSTQTRVLGGAGSDTFYVSAGRLVLDAGAGNDDVETRVGNDDITPGPGIDLVNSGDGNDIVRGVDGTVDQILCGKGADIAYVDAGLDVVSSDPEQWCESLQETRPPAPSVALPTKTKYVVPRTGVVRFALTNRSAFGVSVKVVAKRRTLLVTKGSGTLAAKDTGRIRTVVPRKVRRLLLKQGRIRAVVRYTLTGNGQTVTKKQTVTFVPKR